MSGSYAYLASPGNFNGSFHVIDVSVPSLPVEVAYLLTPGDAWGVAVAGSHAFVAATGELSVIDVSTPSAPVEVALVPVGGRAHTVVISRGYAYVAYDNYV